MRLHLTYPLDDVSWITIIDAACEFLDAGDVEAAEDLLTQARMVIADGRSRAECLADSRPRRDSIESERRDSLRHEHATGRSNASG